MRSLLSKIGLMRPSYPNLPKAVKAEVDLMKVDGGDRLSPWRHDSYAKPYTYQRPIGGSFWEDTPTDPRPNLTELPPNWEKLPIGSYQYTVPVDLRLTVDDFYAGEEASFPYRLNTPLNMPDTGSLRNDAPYEMGAERVALWLYHYMKKHIPGFDALNGSTGYDPQEFWKRFKIHVPNWGTICFWNFGGDMKADNGAVLRVLKPFDENGSFVLVEPLTRQVPNPNHAYPCKDICYEGDEHYGPQYKKLPNKPETVDNIITVFAVIHAIGRQVPKWEDPRGEWNPHRW